MTQSSGRRPLLDASKQNVICALLALGCSRRTAAAYVGCTRDTIRRTALRDPEFGIQLEHAEAQQEVTMSHLLHTAAKDPRHWRAAAWILERRFPSRYAARSGDTLSRQAVDRILSAMVQIVLEEVPEPRRRTRIRKRLTDTIALFTERTPPKATR